MASPAPAVLRALGSSADLEERDRAWAAFLDQYSDLILHVSRTLGGDHDAAMDRYAFALDALRHDGCRRLRAWDGAGGGSFTTWLAVVVRRLCLDEYRHRYGRAQGHGPASPDQRVARRNLEDLLGTELGLDALAAAADGEPDATLLRRERRAALDRALQRVDATDRLILRLRFEDDVSVPEIARVLSLGSPFRLYRRITRLLATLRGFLAESGVHDGSA